MTNKLINIGLKARKSARILATISAEKKNIALSEIANSIQRNKSEIFKVNNIDLADAKRLGLPNTLIARLSLNENKISEILNGIEAVINLEEPIGETISARELANGLELYQVSCPIGVIGVIFESRPDALVQIACLCIKSGNATILKGGKEAKNTNKYLASLIRATLEKLNLPQDTIQLIETKTDVREMLKLDIYIDLIIPRGSYKLVKFIKSHTRIPVIAHDEGICHVYVDKYADIEKALDICIDAKCQYPAVCNAMETLLVHRDIAKKFLPLVAERFRAYNLELRGDTQTRSIIKDIKPALESDWKTEYCDLILSIRIVNSLEDAIEHINKYGSNHTDAIVTEDNHSAFRFIEEVNSSSVMRNCSTRFSDGYRYGMGAELGISTSKIPPRGPVGLEGLVTYKYILIGNGHVVGHYTGRDSKRFTHKEISKKFRKFSDDTVTRKPLNLS